MKYASMRYEKSENERQLILHSFDGTFRSVAFKSDDDMASALVKGRAQVDCTAVEAGMLPRGAGFVSRAAAQDPRAVLAEMNGQGTSAVDPLDAVRLGFSQQLLAGRSEFIDESRDVKARRDRPEDARRYESLVASVGRSIENGESF